GVGDPHCRGGRARRQKLWRGFRGGSEHGAIVAREAETAQRGNVGPLVRRQNALSEPAVGERLHLRESLQRGLARIRGEALVPFRGEIAFGEAAVVVRRPREAVEVDFGRGRIHKRSRGDSGTARTSSPVATPSRRAACGSNGKVATRSGAGARIVRKPSKRLLATSHTRSSVRLSGTGFSSPIATGSVRLWRTARMSSRKHSSVGPASKMST